MRRKLPTLIILLSVAFLLPQASHAKRLCKAAHKANHHKISHKLSYSEPREPVYEQSFDTDSVTADTLLNFAQNLIGTRYRSATSDPERGFDCSGFVSYVFKNFNFKVPRSSPEFINVGEKVSLEDARPGDIIIFTSPTHKHRIGHVGIVYANNSDGFKFIHSTSGKEHGVTITTMDDTYRRRFVQIVRLLKQNDTVLASR